MTGAPLWLSLTDSSLLVIDAPNDINIPGNYTFWVSIWEVTLQVEAPCSTNLLIGPAQSGFVAVYIDELIVLVVDFEIDDKQQSWEQSCGNI